MEDRTIRPSMKTVWFAYALVSVVVVVGIWAWYNYAQDKPAWLMAVPLIFLVFPVKMHLKRRLVSMRLHDYHLTLETGFFSRTRRTVDMAKIQDVTVKQSFGQRLLGVGDIMMESAGEAGAMGIRNLDSPRHLADEIIRGSKQALQARATGNPTPPAA